MHKNYRVSVLIPAYNEEETIEQLVKAIDELFSENYRDYEIIVIDDASTDNTLTICENLKKRINNLRVFSNNQNLGKTQTVLNGFGKTESDIISFIDADYQYDPRDLINVINEVKKGYDICCGNRKNRNDSFYRKLLSKGFNLLNRIMFGIKVNDVNCGLKAFRKGAMEELKLKYLDAPWFIDTETLTRAYNKKMKVTQVDINHLHRTTGSSKINTLSVIKETLRYSILLKIDCLKQE